MICYAFPDLDTWRQLALSTGLAATIEGQFRLLSTHDIAIDEVGAVPLVDAVVGPDGEVITPPVMAPGFHVNLVHPDPPEELDDYLQIVSTPYRVFLGQPVGPVPDNTTLAQIAES
jgi:hypothetical protein